MPTTSVSRLAERVAAQGTGPFPYLHGGAVSAIKA